MFFSPITYSLYSRFDFLLVEVQEVSAAFLFGQALYKVIVL